MKVLDGIRALDWGQFLPPSAGYMLGDMGADVIKIEDPVRGDALRGMSSMYGSAMSWAGGTQVNFETSNRNKRSITLDLKKEKGREILYGLVEKSDVFHTNFSERVARSLGVDYDTLSQKNPMLIYGAVSNYGPRGPWAEKRGFDPTAQARSGLMWAIGERDFPEPMQAGFPICDTMAAIMLVYGTLAALVARERQGIGQKIEVSLLGSMLHLQGMAINVASLRGRPWARHSRRKVRNPLTNHYRCADGKWVIISEVQADRFWSEFCHATGLEEIENDPRFATAMGGRREHSAELIEILDKTFATKTRDEWVRTFEERGVQFAYSPVQDYYEILEDPQALVNDYLVEFDHPVGGQCKVIGFPVHFSKTPCQIKSAAPQHGEHTEEVLMELLNYTWEDIERLKSEEVI